MREKVAGNTYPNERNTSKDLLKRLYRKVMDYETQILILALNKDFNENTFLLLPNVIIATTQCKPMRKKQKMQRYRNRVSELVTNETLFCQDNIQQQK